MHQYPYFATDAGRYMVSEAETRALLDYVLKHRNIAAILTFGESDNLIAGRRPPGGRRRPQPGRLRRARECADARRVGMMPGPGRRPRAAASGAAAAMFMFGDEGGPGGRGAQAAAPAAARRHAGVQPATTVNAADLEYLNAIAAQVPRADRPSQRGLHAGAGRRVLRVRLLPVRRAVVLDAGLGPAGRRAACRPRRAARRAPGEAARRPAGAPAGMPGTAMAGGVRPARRGPRRRRGRRTGAEGDAGEGIDLRLLQWMDGEKVDGFVNWTPFKHPTLGDVEIGGLQAVRDREPAGREDRRPRRGAREVRRPPDVALREASRSPRPR